MTKTQNYQLPQWVKSDRIMMDDFNEAMRNIESGITAAKSTADAALSSAGGASSSLETRVQELQAAIDKQKQELQSSINSNVASINQQISTINATLASHAEDIGKRSLVKLGTLSENAPVSLPNLTPYSTLLLVISSPGKCTLFLNENDSQELAYREGDTAKGAQAVAWISPVDSGVAVMSHIVNGAGVNSSSRAGIFTTVTWGQLRTMRLTGVSAASLYGVMA